MELFSNPDRLESEGVPERACEMFKKGTFNFAYCLRFSTLHRL